MAARINRGLCGECQICGDLCPHNAIRFAGINRTIAEIIAEVMKDMEYYQESNGGLTISGGEPFVQYEGFLTLIRESKQQGLHIAVETTGHVDMAKMVEAEPYIDLFLFDLKHTDRRVLKEVTGAELDKVLKNLEYIAAQSPAKLILRIPVIPTFNDNGETLRQMFALAVQYQVREVHLLPYHTLGKNKYNQIGKKYNFIDGNIDKKLLNTFLDAAETKGLTIVIGG
ncbi:hypothetical protein P22_1135 [Propionispora sp. 2/2-37]|uniref:glycyl-radical enzyme activating protein n=1 Tax=Propionispora sp. 2/2-37 TaxID=1677858 RepID=UPI0006BB5D55|nr:glycyl-radical enzyme activating protein [Propionispora sp. 2/2-37]CUH95066.1 hypothetical protein P22_1135 [Propionispora sp. 2/2-37]